MSSKENDAIIAFMFESGVPFRVTATTGSGHANGSYHNRIGTGGIGLAVDLAEPQAGTHDSPGLFAIFNTLYTRKRQLAELIYAGAPTQVKDGHDVPASFYGATVMAAHHNHVHVAVERGTFLYVNPGVKPMYDPPLQVVAELDCPTGGVWCLGPDGAVFAWGGAPYLGGANGKPYFAGRTAARLNLVDGKYQIVATSGEVYGPGF